MRKHDEIREISKVSVFYQGSFLKIVKNPQICHGCCINHGIYVVYVQILKSKLAD